MALLEVRTVVRVVDDQRHQARLACAFDAGAHLLGRHLVPPVGVCPGIVPEAAAVAPRDRGADARGAASVMAVPSALNRLNASWLMRSSEPCANASCQPRTTTTRAGKTMGERSVTRRAADAAMSMMTGRAGSRNRAKGQAGHGWYRR